MKDILMIFHRSRTQSLGPKVPQTREEPVNHQADEESYVKKES